MGWVRKQTPIGTIDKQIQLFEDRLTDQDFVAKDQRFLDRVPTHEIEENPIRDADRFLSPIGILGNALTASADADFLQNMGRYDRPNGPGINEGVGTVRTNRLSTQFPGPMEGRIYGICQHDIDADFAHGISP
jgi:hypothetical protein